MKTLRQRAPLYILLMLVAIILFTFYALARENPNTLTVAFLDVGQGDAIFIESPTGTQIVIDGGPGKSILRELPKVMPIYDRSIDAIMITNPDADHSAGFIDVLYRYDVGLEIEPGTEKHTITYQTLEGVLESKGVKRILARRGMKLDLGGGAHLEILYPDLDVANYSPNDGSIVAKLIYGKTSVMLMGDATERVERHLLAIASTSVYKTDLLKLGHHGSKTSSSQSWLEAVSPSAAIISVGLDNRYGLPSPVVTERLASGSIPYLQTSEEGTIVYESDGSTFIRK